MVGYIKYLFEIEKDSPNNFPFVNNNNNDNNNIFISRG